MKKLFFNLRKAKSKLGALEEGDLRPENVAQIAHDLNVSEQEVIDMNRRLSGGDASLNATVGSGDGESTAHCNCAAIRECLRQTVGRPSGSAPLRSISPRP